MGRKIKTSIDYYPMNANVTYNLKVRHILRDHGHAGFFVWMCLLDKIYGKHGYYVDVTNHEEMELFADEHCKVSIDIFYEIIKTCCKRKLFNQKIYDSTGMLTSHAIQENYLYATYEKRRHGGVVHLEWNLLDLSAEKLNFSAEKLFVNVKVVKDDQITPLKNVISPRKNQELPWQEHGKIPQIRLDNTRLYDTCSTGTEQTKKLAFELDKSNSVSNETPVVDNEIAEVDKKTKPATRIQEPALPAPEPPSLDRDYSGLKNRGRKVPKNASRKKKIDNSEVPYWKELVDLWFTFCYEKYNAKPSFAGRDPKDFKEIVLILKSRHEKLREESGADKIPEWTESVAKSRLRNFLGVAYTDVWLKDNFLLSNLNKQKDKVFLNQITNANGKTKQHSGVQSGGQNNKLSAGKNMVFD